MPRLHTQTHPCALTCYLPTDRYHEAKAAVAQAEAKVESDPSDQNLLALENAQSRLVEAGGLDIEQRVDNILSGLGFTRADYTKPCTDFSGGWQMRIALAR